MSDGPYRDPIQLPTVRRLEAEEAIARWEAMADPLLDIFLPRELRERIEELRTGAERESDDARVELAGLLEEALSVAKDRELELRSPPDGHPAPPPLDDVWGPVGVEAAAMPILEQAQAAVREVDGGAEVTRTGPRITARFTVRAVPTLWSLDLGGEVGLRAGGNAVTFTTSSHWMAVRVSDKTPKLFIRREGVADAVLKALRLRADAEVDDGVFDDAFFVEGDSVFARALLTKRLRDAFRGRAGLGAFTFGLDGSTASLAWKGGLLSGLVTKAAFPASVDILVAMRDALGGLRLSHPDAAPLVTK
jgi:hypothetical protein